MKNDPSANFINRFDLPEGFEEQQELPVSPPRVPTSPHEILDSEFAEVEPPTEEEFNASNGPRDERDMNEDFPKFARAAQDSAKAANRAAFDLEMRLHTEDLTKQKTFSIYGPPIAKDILDFISDELGESKGSVILAALVLFYRNCFADERRMLHDIGFFLDNLALQNQELCMETSALEDLAQQAIELESSPYFSPDEKEFEELPDVDFSDGRTYKSPPPPPSAIQKRRKDEQS